jgi:phosphohistidine phosphatase
MRLLVIRHAIAEDREAFGATGRDDSLRPLTTKGRRKMREVARGLRTVMPGIDLLASSPLVRAMQTARIVSRAYDKLPIAEIAELEPDQGPEAFAEWLAQRSEATVAAVGHEPMLSLTVSFFLTGRAGAFLELKKGSACLVNFADRVEPGAGVLQWMLPPKPLRSLGA